MHTVYVVFAGFRICSSKYSAIDDESVRKSYVYVKLMKKKE